MELVLLSRYPNDSFLCCLLTETIHLIAHKFVYSPNPKFIINILVPFIARSSKTAIALFVTLIIKLISSVHFSFHTNYSLYKQLKLSLFLFYRKSLKKREANSTNSELFYTNLIPKSC